MPGVPGSIARPAVTVCSGGEVPGYWAQQCDQVCWPAGRDPYSGGTIYTCQGTCRSVFVRTGPPAPMTCVNLPAHPAVAPVPPRMEVRPIRDWNAGANSEDQLDGDVRLRFTQGKVVGVICGLTQDRSDVANIDRYGYAFYFFQTDSGEPRYRIREGAAMVTPDAPYVVGDEFEIRRVAGVVEYAREGVRLRRASALNSGVLSAGAALFATGDAI